MEYDFTPNFGEIGRRVRKLREERHLTQEALAEAAGVSVPYVSHIERGIKKPSLGTLLRLSAALDVTVDALLRGNQPAEANAFFSDVQELLNDCSQKERKVLLEIAAAVKQILRDAAEVKKIEASGLNKAAGSDDFLHFRIALVDQWRYPDL